jgi:hypothetical protein
MLCTTLYLRAPVSSGGRRGPAPVREEVRISAAGAVGLARAVLDAAQSAGQWVAAPARAALALRHLRGQVLRGGAKGGEAR